MFSYKFYWEHKKKQLTAVFFFLYCFFLHQYKLLQKQLFTTTGMFSGAKISVLYKRSFAEVQWEPGISPWARYHQDFRRISEISLSLLHVCSSSDTDEASASRSQWRVIYLAASLSVVRTAPPQWIPGLVYTTCLRQRPTYLRAQQSSVIVIHVSLWGLQ